MALIWWMVATSAVAAIHGQQLDSAPSLLDSPAEPNPQLLDSQPRQFPDSAVIPDSQPAVIPDPGPAVIPDSLPDNLYGLSDGWDSVLSAPIQYEFTCTGRNYGYYADVNNNCQLFHVCMPVLDASGALERTAQFSFYCANETVFDQRSLTCVFTSRAAGACQDAPALYDATNREFFRDAPTGGQGQGQSVGPAGSASGQSQVRPAGSGSAGVGVSRGAGPQLALFAASPLLGATRAPLDADGNPIIGTTEGRRDGLLGATRAPLDADGNPIIGTTEGRPDGLLGATRAPLDADGNPILGSTSARPLGPNGQPLLGSTNL